MSSDKSTVRINTEIRAPQIRLIGGEGQQLGVVTVREALQAAEEADLDLVEISPDAEPPVCRIMDYGKFLFERNKRKAAQKKKQKQIQIKEIKLRPVTEEGDYQVKLRSLLRFLEHGDKVKITLRFRGREMSHMELGVKLMQRMQQELEQHAVIEQMPKLEGRQMVMMVSPKKK